MGYTHYWDGVPSNVTPKQWNTFAANVQKIIDTTRIKLSWEYDQTSRPAYVGQSNPDTPNSAYVRFNGLDDNGYETFVLDETDQFCKTARKPYDTVVVAVLTLAHHELGLQVRSDGSCAEWQNGVRMLNRVLSTEYKTPESLKRKNQNW